MCFPTSMLKGPSDKMTPAFEKEVSALANSVGDFIRYWGFRRIHGQIWTLLYLKNQPLSPTEIATGLQVSKSLVSSALVELEENELISPFEDTKNSNKKTKYFKAEHEVIYIIQNILKTRELQIIKNVNQNIKSLQSSKSKVDLERLNNLDLWTSLAQSSVESLSNLDDLEELPSF